MWLPLLGLLLGLLLGSIFTFSVPIVFAKYLSIAVLSALDSLLGGFRALSEKRFDGTVLISGFLVNSILAAILAYLGDRLGLDLYLAAVIVFGMRIFNNISVLRRYFVDSYRSHKKEGAKVKGKR